jgi:hypothetical protein
MLGLMFSQIALAAAAALGVQETPRLRAADPAPPRVEVPAVKARPRDKTVLDVLNDSRQDILGRGAARHCPPVTAVYVNGERRFAPAIDHGFSRATLYFAGDTVMIMLPPPIADALRTVKAAAVRTVRYLDCTANVSDGEERNTLYITTK